MEAPKKNSKKVTPNPNATFDEKKMDSYGLQIAQYISGDWFNNGMISQGCNFFNRRQYVEEQRLYVRGEQDTTNYKNILARQSGDLSYLNMDWRSLNIPAKFCNIVTNGISEENYRLDIRAVDRYSMLEKQRKMDEHRKNMISKDIVQKAKEVLNIDIAPQGYVPEDDEDLMFHTEIKDRPKIEIAEEITIDFVKKINNFKSIKNQCDKDIVETGIMCAQVYTDPINGVSLRYVDPENAIHSYVNKNDFSDCFYFGYVDTITLSDIKRESNLDDKTLREIAKNYAGTNANMWNSSDYMTCPFEEIIDLKINVLRFAWKTSKTLTFKKYIKKGEVIKVAKRGEDWAVPQGGEKSVLSKVYDTWLEGNYIIGTQTIYGYKECENIVKDEMNLVRPPFVFRSSNIYKNKLHSFLSDIKPLCDQMQYAHLKIQHLMAELKPDLIEIDLDGLADLSTGTKGENKGETWKTALSILNVKGVVFRKRIDMGEMGMKETTAARPVPQQQGSALGALLNVWAHYYNLLREITGINPARDGSLPADALLGVNQMAQLASNTVTKHIVDAAIEFDRIICEIISIRVKSIACYKEGASIMETYKRAIGKHNMEAMQAMENRHLYDFGFTIEMIPSGKEISEFKEDLSICLKEGTVDVEDKIEAENLAKVNVKLANEYLKYRRRIRIKQQAKEKQEMIMAQTQGNIQSSQAKSQSDVQAYGLKKKIDLDYAAAMAEIEIQKTDALNKINAPVKDSDFEKDVYIERIKSATNFDLAKYKEEAKDVRVDKQSTNQSKMIKQRQDNSESIDFENQNYFYTNNYI